MDQGGNRRDKDPLNPSVGGIRTPAVGESSSAGIPPIPKKPDPPPSDPFDAATRLDLNIHDLDGLTLLPLDPRQPDQAAFGETRYGQPPVSHPDPPESAQTLPPKNRTSEPARPKPAPSDAPTVMFGAVKPTPPPRTPQPTMNLSGYRGDPVLVEGSTLGDRYHIDRILGEGGMGTVYKATDVILNRPVALKLIRPDLALNPAIIERFKQELTLATLVTHKNVVRIYDLGEADGLKFITMEFVEGSDLRALIHDRLERGEKIPPAEAAEIIAQCCRALEAAHSIGIIHRDLKPQNIMRDAAGRVVVMDFGLARTLGGDGMTQSGALIGTMEYMSPEQALARELDQRSDIFSLGLIFYELLTGELPFRADSAIASLIKRTQERVVPISEIDSTIPRPLNDIVCRCLERDISLRYQTTTEILADLEAWQGKRAYAPASTISSPALSTAGQSAVTLAAPVAAPSAATPSEKPKPLRRILAGAALLVLLLAGAAYTARDRLFPHTGTSAATGPEVALAILPFRNATADPSLDWVGPSVADMLSNAIGQSQQLKTVSSSRIRQVLSDLRVSSDSAIDPDMLRRVAEFSSATSIVSGQYVRTGDQVRVDLTLQDLKGDHAPVPIQAQASEKDIPALVASLAKTLRGSLALSASAKHDLQTQSFEPSTKSVEALRDYNLGLTQLRDGRYLDAHRLFQSAAGSDPQFALAYARLAEAQSELGYQSEAEQSARRAGDLANGASLPAPEKFLIDAIRARVLNDTPKAIAAYETLARNLPGDTDIQARLGSLYLDNGDYAKARQQFTAVLTADPKNIRGLWLMGVLEFTSGNDQAALDPLGRGLSLSIQTDNPEQHALYLLAMGICYRLLNKPEEALRNYQDAIAISEKIGQKRVIANTLTERAAVQTSLGKSTDALSSYDRALALLREIGMKREIASTLLDKGALLQDLGDYDQTLDAYKQALQILRESSDPSEESRCLNNIGSVYLSKGDADNAFTYYQQALQIRQKLGVPDAIAETKEGLGEAYTTTGQYDNALTAFISALDLSRKAGNQPQAAVISHEMGLVFQFQGRYGAAISSMQDGAKIFHTLNQHDRAAAELFKDLGDTLAKAGRFDEVDTPLTEADSLARELKNEALQASILSVRGDLCLYRRDFKSANASYQQALKLATIDKSRDQITRARLGLARSAIAQGLNPAQAKTTIATLRELIPIADSLDAHLSMQCSVALADALVQTKDYAHARETLEQILGTAERSGMRIDLAKIHYLLGNRSRLGGDTGLASLQYRQAIQILDTVRKEPGAEKLLDRPDLKLLYEQSTASLQN